MAMARGSDALFFVGVMKHPSPTLAVFKFFTAPVETDKMCSLSRDNR